VRNRKVSKLGKHSLKLHLIGATVTYKILKKENFMKPYYESKDIYVVTVECV
jgi:hypothetical protein